MAESQVPYNYDDDDDDDGGTLENLGKVLSSPRFKPYLIEANGNELYALELYLFNARVAKSLLFPIQMAEITVRNAVNKVFVEDFGQRWPFNGGFYDEYKNLHPVTAITTARDRLKAVGKNYPTTDDVVAALTFDFWSNLFRSDYDRFLWATSGRVHRVFPKLPGDKGRADIQVLVRQINRLRNRIAHHEPIIDRNKVRKTKVDPDDISLQDLHSAIISLIGYCCEKTKKWVKHYSTFGVTVRNRPLRGARIAGQPIGNAASKKFTLFQLTDNLDKVINTLSSVEGIGLVDIKKGEKSFAAITSSDVLAWAHKNQADGYVAFQDGTVADALELAPPRVVVCMPSSSTMTEAAALMYADKVAAKDRAWLIVAIDDKETPGPIGILVRPLVKIS